MSERTVVTSTLPAKKRGFFHSHLSLWSLCVALCSLCPVVSVSAQEEADPNAPTVERIDIVRNQFLDKETFLFYISTKPGDRYDERRVKDDFRRVWDTGFVEDLLVDVRDGEKGKIITFVVDERRRIAIV